jgi:sugar phosphate isomerase/epimerase
MTQTSLPPRRSQMGLSADSFQSIRFATATRLFAADTLMELAAALGMAGAHGGMPDITFEWARHTRELKEKLGVYLEIQTFLPRAGEDVAVFEHAVKVAKEAGASSLRVVCLLGRRYEMFDTRAQWEDAVKGFHRQIQAAVPIVEKHKVRLGIENHKDWRVDQQVELLNQYSSEYVGVSLDTGNNLSILDNPEETVEKLAPWTFSTHFKDMAVEETEDGFLMSEVPLGEGLLDLPRMVAAIRRARPEAHFSLEMITRDPLRVPCLTEKYWATLTEVPGVELARFLTRMRANKPKRPLPRITGLNDEQRYALEVEMVDRSIAYASAHLGLEG